MKKLLIWIGIICMFSFIILSIRNQYEKGLRYKAASIQAEKEKEGIKNGFNTRK